MNVLFMSPWYPHRYDAMSGLFVRKHAEAVARQCEVTTLYLYPDANVSEPEVMVQTTNGVHEIYLYYPFVDRPLLRQLTKALNFFKAFRKGYKEVKARFGRPDVVQANVLTRCGALAWWLKRREGIPYVIVEHWTRYLPQNFNYKGWLRRWVSEQVEKEASCVLPVSRMLCDAMRSHGLVHSNYQVVNNVVDDFFFEQPISADRVHGKFRFLHVSCFIERAKNVCGMLRVVKRLSGERSDFVFTIIGIGPDFEEVKRYAETLDLPDGLVSFVGEQQPRQVCSYFAESDAFVMFSNYENAPVVISESLAMGVPVISTRVGGIADMIDAQSGVLIEAGDEQALYEQMIGMMAHRSEFDAEKIRQRARRYSYETVGNFLVERYQECL
ncbi:MAG: glycosyltransferase [Paludibacteraceae bacterium]|nr:glycosyltransferase [Paludibacteraceae bacterium]